MQIIALYYFEKIMWYKYMVSLVPLFQVFIPLTIRFSVVIQFSRTRAHNHLKTHTNPHSNMHTNTQTHTHTHTHTQTHTHTHTRILTRKHLHTHTHTHTFTHVHARAGTPGWARVHCRSWVPRSFPARMPGAKAHTQRPKPSKTQPYLNVWSFTWTYVCIWHICICIYHLHICTYL